MSTIIKLLIIYIVSIGAVLVFVNWYFRFLISKMITQKINDIDYLVETGKIRSKYNLSIVNKFFRKNIAAEKIINSCKKRREIVKVKKLLSFIIQNGFMSDEDRFNYKAAIEDILKNTVSGEYKA